jgi:hypothetical protein
MMFVDPKGLFPAPWCTKWEILLGQCPDVGDDIQPEDVPEEWVKDWINDVCNKPCDAIEAACKRAMGPACYVSGTPCLVPCTVVKMKCEEKQKKECQVSQCELDTNS